MLARWLLTLAFVIGLAIVMLDVASGARARTSGPRTPASIDAVTARGEDPSLPQTSGADDTALDPTPALTY